MPRWRSFDLALSLQESSDDRAEIPRTLARRGVSRFAEGDSAGALADLRRAVNLSSSLGDRPAEVEIVRYLAFVEAELGELGSAVAHLEHSRELATELALLPELTILANNLGVVAMEREDYASAEVQLHLAAALARRARLPHRAALAIGNLGILCALRGDFARASSLLDEAVQLVAERMDWPMRWVFLGHRAALAARTDGANASELFASVSENAPPSARAVIEVLAMCQVLNRAHHALDRGDLAMAWEALAATRPGRSVEPTNRVPSADLRLATVFVDRYRRELEQRAALRLDADAQTLVLAQAYRSTCSVGQCCGRSCERSSRREGRVQGSRSPSPT